MPLSTMTAELRSKTWIMYLRKSRQDDPSESVEETLSKHETWLQEWAMRELGRAIPEENIYREVISGGESIDEREEMRKVLALMENPNVAGVLCKDPQRLTRGSLEDCGRLITTLLYTKTLVATPMMTYDLSDKMHHKFFESELMRGRDYLDYTKEILWIGRMNSAKRGCFIASRVPFGYNRVKIGKDWTLEPNENADYVRMMFDWYVNHNLLYSQIADKMNELGIPSPLGKEWKKSTIRWILLNKHYDGKIVFNSKRKTTIVENGRKISKRLIQAEDDVIVVEGKHPPLVDHETFQRAQDKLRLNPPSKTSYDITNPLCGIFKCKTCGRSVTLHPYKYAENRLECRSRHFKTAKVSEVTAALIAVLELSELPQLEAKLTNGEGKSAVIQQRLLDKIEKQMEEYRRQEEKQYDFLETGIYTQQKFEERNAALRKKMEDCQKQIVEARRSLPQAVDYAEKIATLKRAIAALKDDTIPAKEKNILLKSIIERCEMTTSNRGHGKTDIELDVFLRL